MCDFKPGDEVVCVRGAPAVVLDGRTFELIQGRTYTILDVACAGQKTAMGWIASGEPHVQLVEFGHYETPQAWGMRASRFRKVQRRDLTAWLATENAVEGPVRVPVKEIAA